MSGYVGERVGWVEGGSHEAKVDAGRLVTERPFEDQASSACVHGITARSRKKKLTGRAGVGDAARNVLSEMRSFH